MKQWHEFLKDQGALFTDGANSHVTSFGSPASELEAVQGNVLADLSHLSLIELEGDDVVTFLQGQVTNDVKLLNGSNSHYAGYCNPKGRMLALFLAFSHSDHIHLQVNGELIDPILKRLKMYVLRSKVSIKDASDTIVRMGVAGPKAQATLQGIFEHVPEQPHELASLPNGALIRLPGPVPRYQVFSSLEQAPAIWNKLKQAHQPVGRKVWEWLEIQAGIPDIVPATQEEFVPQMVNLDALGGINFKKGCYTGQEIVARTHYLGKVKRRTQLAHVASSEAPQAGDNVIGADGNEAGKIVRSAAAPLGGYDVLAEVRLESLEGGSLRWKDSELEIRPLPYALP